MKRKVLVVGIGNEIRQDDGIGPFSVNLIREIWSDEKRELVDLMTVHQLDVLHCDIFTGYPVIIFIDADAGQGNESFRIEEIRPEPASRPFTSHIGSIPDLLSLTGTLHETTPRAYLVAVKGASFEVGEGLSRTAVNNVRQALAALDKLIGEFFPLA